MTITINGKKLEVAEGLTILEAARMNGILIPTLCYLKELNEVAACRMCVVEVKGSERLVAACNTKVAQGMEIVTDSEKVIAARRRARRCETHGRQLHVLRTVHHALSRRGAPRAR